MNALAINIVHPAYENLKRTGRFFHLVAGLIIILNSIHELQLPKINHLYFWCQLFIGADILIMALTSRNLAQDLPKVNMIFRSIECVIFLGAAMILLMETNWIMGAVLILISTAYAYLMFCEHRIYYTERVTFHHMGVTISGIPSSRFFVWAAINRIDAHYDSIIIETAQNKTYHFNLRQNLRFEELDQIHEFCRHYLKQAVSS
jgi:hypothetical protein